MKVKAKGAKQKENHPKHTASRARADSATVERRIDVIIGHMAECTWDGPTAAKLASSWGISDSNVGAHAAEASRIVRRVISSSDLPTTIAIATSRMVARALERDDARSDLVALQGFALLLGLHDRERGAVPGLREEDAARAAIRVLREKAPEALAKALGSADEK